jgi:glycogen debranching enzyme
MEGVIVFSALSKFMGSYPTDWDNHLRGISQRGYNMVHFTPLTIRGESNSPYSIYDQLHFDDTVFPKGEADIATMVEKMHTEFNMLAMTDVVWNHTANNSKWLEEHPEAGYNVDTAPHLRPALELDSELLKFGKNLSAYGLPTKFENEGDLLKVMGGVKEKVLGSLKLWEYYTLDVDRDASAIMEKWVAGQAKFPEDGFSDAGLRGLDAVKNWPLKQKADWLVDHALVGGDRMGERFRRRIDPATGAGLLCALFGRYDSRTSSAPDERAAKEAIINILNELNLPFYKEYDGDAKEIMEQLFNRIKYVRIDAHGPKLGEVNDANPLIETYFTRLPLNATTKKHNPEALALVNNGWVWAADAMRDNAGP